MTKLIAIIDDERDMEFIYTMMLEDELESRAVEVKFFHDSREFDRWIKNHSPDLIMSDINMPHLSGIELRHRILKTGKPVPTYFISGHDKQDYAACMKELGICRYLSKPINSQDFIEFVKTDLNL